MSLFKLPLLLVLFWCTFTHAVSQGARSFQSVEGYVLPPVGSSNGTTSAGSQVVKRFFDYTRACREIYSRLDPRKYFGTRDIFIPRYVYTVECAGTPSEPLACGPSGSRMRCLTRMGRVELVRMPRSPSQCRKRRRVVISDIPVGCYCV